MVALCLPFYSPDFPAEHGSSVIDQIRRLPPVEVGFAVRPSNQTVQFHELRLSALRYWLTQAFGLAGAKGESLLERAAFPHVRLNSPELGLVASWQFSLRSALHPRAPCWAVIHLRP